jgi:hypothetical protein
MLNPQSNPVPLRDPFVGNSAEFLSLCLRNPARSLSPVAVVEFTFALLQMIRAVTGELAWTNSH